MARRLKLSRMSFIFIELGQFSGDVHKNFLPPELGRVTSNSHILILSELPCGYVILPAVPRTSHNFVLERPLSQRPSAVQASVIDRVEFAAHISDRYGFARRPKLADSTRRNLGDL